MPKINLDVRGMHCKSCKMLIEDALDEMGAKNIKVSVDEKKKTGEVSCDHASKEEVISAIEKEGYVVIGHKIVDR